MLQDYKLGLRMLLKYPGLTIAGGLALAIAIAIGAGWYDLVGKVLLPTIPLPEGDRIVLIDTRNILTNGSNSVSARLPRMATRAAHYRGSGSVPSEPPERAQTDRRPNLIVGTGAPERIQLAELTAAAFRMARVLRCSVAPCSSPMKCREPPASSSWDTTCGSARSVAGRTSSDRW